MRARRGSGRKMSSFCRQGTGQSELAASARSFVSELPAQSRGWDLFGDAQSLIRSAMLRTPPDHSSAM